MSAVILVTSQEFGVVYADHGTATGCNPADDCEEAKIFRRNNQLAISFCGELKELYNTSYLLQQFVEPLSNDTLSATDLHERLRDFFVLHPVKGVQCRALAKENGRINPICFQTENGGTLQTVEPNWTINGFQIYLAGCAFTEQVNVDLSRDTFTAITNWTAYEVEKAIRSIVGNLQSVNCCHVSPQGTYGTVSIF